MKLFAKSSAGKQSYEEIPSGKVKLGVETDGSCGFVWDNEGPPKVTAHLNTPLRGLGLVAVLK